MRPNRLAPLVVAALLLAGTGTATADEGSVLTTYRHTRCQLPVFGPGSQYKPGIEPRNFTTHVTNPWFPLKPGRTMVYTGVKDGEPAMDIVVVTSRTRMVGGVRTRVVEDRLYLSGVLHERTSDYYAQDRCGNVWYFGEDTAELDEHGRVVSREGTFHAEVDGAQPGVVMQHRPQFGRLFRQEWYAGHAEDVFKAVRNKAVVTVPYGHFTHALQTSEFTALEPGVLDAKFYVRGVGEVAEVSLRGPREALRLVEIIG